MTRPETTSETTDDLEARIQIASKSVYAVNPKTPVENLDISPSKRISIKREDVSIIRSYKWRGAYNKIRQCVAGGDRGPFAATSAGNHAQGVAVAAQKLDVHATIFMPVTTPKLKQDAAKSLGGDKVTIELVGDNYDQASAAAKEWVMENQATIVPAFDDADVIAGQATVGIEILEQLPQTSAVFVPVGGGGLAAGVCFALRNSKVRVIGVEAKGQAAMQQSLEAKSRVELEHVDRFCDGTAVGIPGALNFEICQSHLDQIVLVENEQVCKAIELLWTQKRLIPEPSGALALAGLLHAANQNIVDTDNEECVVVITGGNTDFLNLPSIVRGSRLSKDSRQFFRFKIDEQYGSLVRLLDDQIREFNIVDFQYGKTSEDTAYPVLGLSGDAEQFDALVKRLDADGCEYEEVTQRETTQFRVIPFRSDMIQDPIFLHVDFPERRGALRDLMREVSAYAGICYFNYTESGTQEGQALIGFECAERQRLLDAIHALGYPYNEVHIDRLFG